ncbi:MAG: plasmid recombination protein [Burkholderiales bacterium]|nr:plasmid recombination protein [Burkholderiales bacterium]
MKKHPLAICRVSKLHQRDLKKAAGHNFRTAPVPNADPGGSITPLHGSSTAKAFLDTVSARFDAWKARKLAAPRKVRGARMARDPVVCVELLLTASPEYFRPHDEKPGEWDKPRAKAWQEAATAFARDYFGANLVSVVLHEEESTPHCHVFVMPFDPSGNLNAKSLFNRQNLVRLQDAYAEACKPLGIGRGLRGSKASHVEVRQHYEATHATVEPTKPAALKPRAPVMPGKIDRLDDDAMRRYAIGAFRAGASAAAQEQAEYVKVLAAKAAAHDLLVKNDEARSQALAKLRDTAAEVRAIALPAVLKRLGAVQGPDGDTWQLPGRRYKTHSGTFREELTGAKGRNAIDLVKHCEDVDYEAAVRWLSKEFGASEAVGEAVRTARDEAATFAAKPTALPVPAPSGLNLAAMKETLASVHGIPPAVIDEVVTCGDLYADRYGSAVFACRDDNGRVIGAEVHTLDDKPVIYRRGAEAAFVLPPAPSAPRTLPALVASNAIEALCLRALRPLCGWVYAVGGVALRGVVSIVRAASRRHRRTTLAITEPDMAIALRDSLIAPLPEVAIEAPWEPTWKDELAAQRNAANAHAMPRYRRPSPSPDL